MAIIIPALFFGALIWLLAGAGRGGLRQCFVYAAAVYTLCLVFATEVFSAGSLLRVETLAVFYGALAVAAGVYARLYGDRQAVLQALRNVPARFMEFPAVLSAAGLVLAIVLLIALVSPPNNWDSMTYHMSRVAMWVQQQSVAHYPTPYLVQNSHPPLAEWNILHFQLLSGGDRFANAVQWLYLFGCGIAASLIARECKAAFPLQALAAVIAVTLPMALLQGSSTQNDVAGSFWILSFTLFVIQYLKEPRWELLLLGGLTAGFALLTKGTLYVILPPVALSLLIYGLTRPGVRAMRIKLLPAAAAILALALVLNVGHYSRNFASFGNPLVPDRNQSQTVDEFGPLVTPFVIYSNLVRNSALHWNVPSYELNWDIMQLMRRVFGEGLESVEGSTVGGAEGGIYRTGIFFYIHEDYTGNFLHFWTALLAVPGIILLRKRLQFNALTVGMALTVLATVVFFCAIIKFQGFNSRYHTPLFMLAAPVVAIFISGVAARIFAAARSRQQQRRQQRRQGRQGRQRRRNAAPDRVAAGNWVAGDWRIIIAAALFLVLCIPWVIFNSSRPVFSANPGLGIFSPRSVSVFSASRPEMYFNSRADMRQAYLAAMEYLAALEPAEVGLYMELDHYDYPVSALFREMAGQSPRLEHIGVTNVSADLREGEWAPEYVFSTKGAAEVIEGQRYVVDQEFGPLTILARADVVGE